MIRRKLNYFKLIIDEEKKAIEFLVPMCWLFYYEKTDSFDFDDRPFQPMREKKTIFSLAFDFYKIAFWTETKSNYWKPKWRKKHVFGVQNLTKEKQIETWLIEDFRQQKN